MDMQSMEDASLHEMLPQKIVVVDLSDYKCTANIIWELRAACQLPALHLWHSANQASLLQLAKAFMELRIYYLFLCT